MRLPSRWLRRIISGYRRDLSQAQRLRSPRMSMMQLEDRVTPTAPVAPPGFTSTTTNFPSSPGTSILDNTTSEATISVSGVGTYLHDIDVFTNITHTWNADIQMILISPAGTMVTLSTGNGGSNDNVFDGTLWDDQADPGNPVPYVSPNAASNMVTDTAYVNLTVEATVTPEEALGAFIGENPNGTWTLRMRDTAGGDTGTLANFNLDVTTLPSAPTINPGLSFSNGSSTPIPDNSFVTSDITIGSAPTYLAGIKVTTNITHTNNGNLDITLTSPTGKVVTLTTDNGGTTDDGFAGTVWDIDADPLGDVPLVAANSFLVTDTAYVNLVAETTLVPEESFAMFFGDDPNGIWTLTVSDDAAVDTGTLNSWSIEIFTVGMGSTAPIAAGSGTAVVLPDGTDHTVTVVYSDFGGSELINFSSIGTGDVRIKAPDASYLLPTSAVATPMSDAKSISVVYTFPAKGGTWNVDDNGVYEIEVIDMQVFDKDSPTPGSVAAGKVGSFTVNIPTNRIYGNTYFDVDTSNTKNAGDTPQAGVLVYADANSNNLFDQVVYNSTDTPLALPDVVTTNSFLTITGYVGTIVDLNVMIDITHTFTGDLDIFLVAPDGFTRIELSTDNGGGGDNFVNTVFDDQAAVSVTVGVAPFTGSFRPETPLSAVAGFDPNGTWTLEITDDAGGDIGTLNSWSLTFGENSVTSDANGDYFIELPNGTHNIRRVLPMSFTGNADPATGTHTVTLNNDSTTGRNFGHVPNPAPEAVGSGAAVTTPDGTTHTVTVVYTDNGGSQLVDFASIGVGDVRIVTPGMTFLTPTSVTATPMGDAKTISVDYTFPALGGSWNVDDNGTYNIEVIGSEVFDKDSPTALSVPAGKVGSFSVNILPNRAYGNTYLDVDNSGSKTAGDTPIAGVIIYNDSNNNMQPDLTDYASPNVPVNIPDLITVTSTVNVSGFTAMVTDLDVHLNITHTWVSDVNIFLIAPDGTRIELSTGNGGSGDNYIDTIFDDSGVNGDVTLGVAPFTGSYIPETPLAVVNGMNPNGVWTLEITDKVNADTGTLNSWKLVFNGGGGEATTVSNANGDYVFVLPDGTHNIRRVVPNLFLPNADPAGGGHMVTVSATASTGNRNFGHTPDPTPLASGSAATVAAPGASHVVTVVYTDPYGLPTALIDVSSIGLDDIQVKAPNGMFLTPTAFVATPNANDPTISVDYTIPALGGSWDSADNGVYEIQVIAGKVFDLDGAPGPYSVAAGTVGTFKVGLPTTYVVGKDGSDDDGNTTTPAETTVVEALRLSETDFGPSIINFSLATGTAVLPGQVLVTEDLTITGPAGGFTISGSGIERLFKLNIPTSTLLLENLTLTGGNAGLGDGGAILADNEDVILNNVTVQGNTAEWGSAIAFSGKGGSLTLNNSSINANTVNQGGTIFFRGSTHLEVQKSIITGNTATIAYPGIVFFYTSSGYNSLNIGDSTISNNSGTSFTGGGLYFQGPVGAKGATISNSLFANNKNNFGAAMGLFAMGTSTFNVIGTRFENNEANLSGGAIYVSGAANLNIVDSAITGNKANGGTTTTGKGGGLFNTGGLNLTVSNSTIANNQANHVGGGFYMGFNGSMSIDRSTISGNQSNLLTANPTFGGGGGIYFYGTATKFDVTNSTISGNSSNSNFGGGVVLAAFTGNANFESSTIVGNDAGVSNGGGIAHVSGTGTVSLSNTIVAQNLAAVGPDLNFAAAANVGGNFNFVGIGDSGNFALTGTNNTAGTLLTPADPMLGALALNGAAPGSPQTHKPLVGSPVLNTGFNGSMLATDQRGGTRTVGTGIGASDGTDIGAVEVQAAPTAVILTNGQVSGQHSLVTSIVIDFDQPVLITDPSMAFTIFRTFNNTAGDTATGTVGYDVAGLDANNYGSSVTLTFNNSGTLGATDPGASLRDGKYTVTVNSAGITGLDSAMAANQMANTWRLFGDGNGDGVVNAADFNDFRLYYGSTNSIPGAIYDYNDDGLINAADFNAFRIRYGTGGYNMP